MRTELTSILGKSQPHLKEPFLSAKTLQYKISWSNSGYFAQVLAFRDAYWEEDRAKVVMADLIAAYPEIGRVGHGSDSSAKSGRQRKRGIRRFDNDATRMVSRCRSGFTGDGCDR